MNNHFEQIYEQSIWTETWTSILNRNMKIQFKQIYEHSISIEIWRNKFLNRYMNNHFKQIFEQLI